MSSISNLHADSTRFPGCPFSAGMAGVPAGLSEGLKGLVRNHVRVFMSQPPEPTCAGNHGVGDDDAYSFLSWAAGQKLSPPGPCWTHRPCLGRLSEAPGLFHPCLLKLPSWAGHWPPTTSICVCVIYVAWSGVGEGIGKRYMWKPKGHCDLSSSPPRVHRLARLTVHPSEDVFVCTP